MRLNQFQSASHSKKPHFLLLGHPVAHSLSPLMHNTAAKHYGFEERYFAIDLDQSELGSLASYFNSEMFRGANVTVPYKELIKEFVDELDKDARMIGAVNTVVRDEDRLMGFNTDLHGFLKPLEPYLNELQGARAIVFGTGGAAKSVVHGLVRSGVEELFLISRTPARITSFDHIDRVQIKSYDEWTAFIDDVLLIVNSTPLGMEPDTDTSPVRIGEEQFLSEKICYDIVYKPLQTRFLEQADSAGSAESIGGLEMLIHQGSRSFQLWTGKPFPVKKIRQTIYEHLR